MPDIVQEFADKIKYGFKALMADFRVFTATLMLLVAVTSFGLGRQSATSSVNQTNNPETEVENREGVQAKSAENAPLNATGNDNNGVFYVASKNGEVYHLPYCSGAKRITEANKITFKSKAEAEAAGYRPAANCKGI